MAIDDLFASWTMQQLMGSTVDRVTSFEYCTPVWPIYRRTVRLRPRSPSMGLCTTLRKRGRDWNRRAALVLLTSGLCHQTSSIGVLLRIYLGPQLGLWAAWIYRPASWRQAEIVTSLIFYPGSGHQSWTCLRGGGEPEPLSLS
jgi:hypothetical protein